MDLKGSLINTKIKIIPSKHLISYLETISESEKVPKNIANVTKGIPCNVVENDEYISEELSLNDIDYESINKITQELSKKKDKGTKKPTIKDQETTKDEDEDKIKNDTMLFLTVSDLDWLYIYLNESRSKNISSTPYLHELLEGSEVIVPENEVIKRNPVLEARCVKLRAQQEAREYRKMTKGVDNVRIRYPEDNINYQLKQINRQLIAIGQFILSIFAGFLFGFRGIEWMVGNLDFGVRLLLGVMCALVIALAEIYFLAKKLNEELNMVETTQLGGPTKLKNVFEDPYEKYFNKLDKAKEPELNAKKDQLIAKDETSKEHQD